MKQIVICILCLGLGWFAGFWSSSHEHEGHGASGLSPEEQQALAQKQAALIQDLQTRLAAKETLILTLNEELAKTRDALAAQYAAPGPEEEEPSSSSHPFMANMQDMAAEVVELQYQEEFDNLKFSLDLSAEQLEAIEAFYAKESERQSRLVQQMFSGQSPEDMQEELMAEMGNDEYFTISDLLEDILTPEQLVTYKANEEKKAIEEKEAMAYSQLSQIQRQFVLDEEQKDAVFEIFYEAEHELSAEDWESLEIDPQDPNFSIKYQELQNERLLEALSKVLTEDQLEVQRKKMEGELEMQRKAMSLFGEGFFVTPTEE